MKKRWVIGGILAALVLWPICYVELGCQPGGYSPQEAIYKPLLSNPKDQRAEARTLLTYPEWHIVYAADSYARHLKARPPSGYAFTRDIRSFWSSYCAVNRATDGASAGDAKLMLYTIGISFSAEMLIKAAYENSVGYASEFIGGWHSTDDVYAARIQRDYGTFMHETPWYNFPFDRAFSNLWRLKDSGFRHWERRLAGSLEYGTKTGYAKLIGWGSGTALGADETVMRIILDAPATSAAEVDTRIRAVSDNIYETPRYAAFTGIAIKLSSAGFGFREIAGNDDIFLTVIARRQSGGADGALLVMPLGDRPGWERRGYLIKVTQLSDRLRALLASGAVVEHIYDY